MVSGRMSERRESSLQGTRAALLVAKCIFLKTIHAQLPLPGARALLMNDAAWDALKTLLPFALASYKERVRTYCASMV